MYSNATSGLGAQVRIFEGLALSLVLLVSLALNLTVCGIIWRTRVLRNKPANTFVANLCIANLLMSACVIPFSLATIVQDRHGTYSDAACQGNGFVSVVSGVAIVMTLCCISVDRYIAVTRPTRYKAIVTVKRACYSLIVVWGQGFLYASFPLFGWSKYEYHPGTLHCSPAWTNDCSLYIYLAVVGFGIPIILMVFTYMRIFFVIRRHARKVSTVRRAGNLKSRNSACANNLTPLTQRLSASPKSSPSPNQYSETLRDSYATEGLNGDGQTQDMCRILSSNLELTSFDGCSMQCSPTDVVSDEFETTLNESSTARIHGNRKQSPEPASSEPRPTGQRSKHGTMRVGAMFRRIHSNIWTRERAQSRRFSREYKVAKTGVVLLIAFLILWMPYMIVHVCSAKVNAPQVLFRLAMWLVFMNGVANPILYALCNSTVKMKFKQIVSQFCALCCKCRRKKKLDNPRISGPVT